MNIGDQPRDLLARQKRFAVVLSGDDQLADRLVERLSMMGSGASNGSLSPSALQFVQFKKLYELWMGEAKPASRVARIFLPGGENEAIQKGLDPSLAKVMGELPSLHRALLLLIYGEDFSYAATAQLLNITVEELMSALAAAKQKFSMTQARDLHATHVANAVPGREVAHDAA